MSLNIDYNLRQAKRNSRVNRHIPLDQLIQSDKFISTTPIQQVEKPKQRRSRSFESNNSSFIEDEEVTKQVKQSDAKRSKFFKMAKNSKSTEGKKLEIKVIENKVDERRMTKIFLGSPSNKQQIFPLPDRSPEMKKFDTNPISSPFEALASQKMIKEKSISLQVASHSLSPKQPERKIGARILKIEPLDNRTNSSEVIPRLGNNIQRLSDQREQDHVIDVFQLKAPEKKVSDKSIAPRRLSINSNSAKVKQVANQLRRNSTAQKFDSAIKAVSAAIDQKIHGQMLLASPPKHMFDHMNTLKPTEDGLSGTQMTLETLTNLVSDGKKKSMELLQISGQEKKIAPRFSKRQQMILDMPVKTVKKVDLNSSGDNDSHRRSFFQFIKNKMTIFQKKDEVQEVEPGPPLRRTHTEQFKQNKNPQSTDLRLHSPAASNRSGRSKVPQKLMRQFRNPKDLWRKTRIVFKALNSWKEVRNDVLLYGTHNYEFRNTFNIMGQINNNNQKLEKSLKANKVTPLKLDQIDMFSVPPPPSSRHSQTNKGNKSKLSHRESEHVKEISCFDTRGRRGLYIHPESKFKQIWSVNIIIFLLYTAFLMPYSLAFFDDTYDSFSAQTTRNSSGMTIIAAVQKNWAYYVDIIADFIFLSDVFITLFSAYFDDNQGVLITSNRKIIMGYMKGWLMIDLASSMPISLIEDSVSSSNASHQYIKMLRFLRLPRLRRLIEVSKLGKYFRTITKDSFLLRFQNFIQENAGVMRLLSIVFTVLACVHISACLWYLTAKLQGFSPDTWVVKNGLMDQSNGHKYLASLYWAVATILTVGYGDISAHTTTERLYAIMWMLIGVAFYTFTIGLITSVVDRIDTRESNLNSKLETIDLFCEEARIPIELKRKIRETMEYHSTMNAYSVIQANNNTVFQNLPTNLRFEVAQQIHNGQLGRLPFFQDQDSTFVANIVPLLQPLKIFASQYVYLKSEHPYEIYFICSGRVNFLMDIGECVFKAWPQGSYFGEIEIIFDKKRICSAKAAPEGDCDLFTLNKKYYQTIIHREYLDIDKQLRELAIEREERIEHTMEKAREVLEAIGIEVPKETLDVPSPHLESSNNLSNPNLRRAQSMASAFSISEHPGTKAAKLKIEKSFDQIALGNRSIGTSRKSLSSSDSFGGSDSEEAIDEEQLKREEAKKRDLHVQNKNQIQYGRKTVIVEQPSEELIDSVNNSEQQKQEKSSDSSSSSGHNIWDDQSSQDISSKSVSSEEESLSIQKESDRKGNITEIPLATEDNEERKSTFLKMVTSKMLSRRRTVTKPKDLTPPQIKIIPYVESSINENPDRVMRFNENSFLAPGKEKNTNFSTLYEGGESLPSPRSVDVQEKVVQMSIITYEQSPRIQDRLNRLKESLTQTSSLEQKVSELETTMATMVCVLETLCARMNQMQREDQAPDNIFSDDGAFSRESDEHPQREQLFEQIYSDQDSPERTQVRRRDIHSAQMEFRSTVSPQSYRRNLLTKNFKRGAPSQLISSPQGSDQMLFLSRKATKKVKKPERWLQEAAGSPYMKKLHK